MENEYFYIDSRGEQIGPVNLNELAAAGIDLTTYVWCAGMKEWQMAKYVPEVAQALRTASADNTPPNFGNSYAEYNRQTCPQEGYEPANQQRCNEPMPSNFLG